MESTERRRLCVVYDCLYPHTVGGAERWLRELSERLAADGHEVTYLTRRQWPRGGAPDLPGVRVVAVAPASGLYTRSGRRRILPPVLFGLGVLWHLLRRGRGYDLVHVAAFPYFSLLAAGAMRRHSGYVLVSEWYEVWGPSYWRQYVGRPASWVGHRVERACLRVQQEALCFSAHTAGRLTAAGYDGPLTILAGMGHDAGAARTTPPATPLVVFAGRHVAEKGLRTLVPAIALARDQLPDLRALVLGDGPERSRLLAAIDDAGLADVMSAPGFVTEERLEQALAAATCVLLPSAREGFGRVVVEAAGYGTPAVVVAGPDNAAVDLVADGTNGFVVASAAPEDLAAGVVAAHRGGTALRRSTAAWFAGSRAGSSERTLDTVVAGYDVLLAERSSTARS